MAAPGLGYFFASLPSFFVMYGCRKTALGQTGQIFLREVLGRLASVELSQIPWYYLGQRKKLFSKYTFFSNI